MRIQDLFDMLRSSDDLLSYFENVTTTPQLVSRLEQLKRQDPEGFFDCLEDLRMAVANALEANLELGASLPTEDDSNDIFGDLNDFSKELDDSPSQPSVDEQPSEPPATENSSSPETK
jgi:hypothetical protein